MRYIRIIYIQIFHVRFSKVQSEFSNIEKGRYKIANFESGRHHKSGAAFLSGDFRIFPCNKERARKSLPTFFVFWQFTYARLALSHLAVAKTGYLGHSYFSILCFIHANSQIPRLSHPHLMLHLILGHRGRFPAKKSS